MFKLGFSDLKWTPYAVALLAPLLASVIRWYLNGALDSSMWVAFYILPIVISALVGGLWPGIVSTIFGLAIGNFLFGDSPLSFGIPQPTTLARITAGLLIGVSSSIVIGVARSAVAKERKALMESQLAERLLSQIVRNISDPFVVVKRNWMIESANSAFCELVGKEEQAVVETLFWDAFPLVDVEETRSKLKWASNTQSHATVEVSAPTGSWYEVRICPAGGDRGSAIFINDVTRNRLLEEARINHLRLEKLARSEAEAANKSKDLFVAVLSHELRTPLTSILGWAEILRSRHGLDPDLHEGLACIESSAKVQARLVDDLVDMSRLVTGRMVFNLELVDLNTAVASVVRQMTPVAVEKGRHFTVELCQEPLEIQADPDRIQQIITNILGNALKFTEPGGNINVRLYQNSNRAFLRIQDDGIGIEPYQLPVLFEPFRQIHRMGKPNGGLGLGLAIVYQLVQAHNGTLVASSDGVGQGACFEVGIPLASPRSGHVVTPLELSQLRK